MYVEPLEPAAVLDTLIRQTVVPNDRRTAASILQTVAATAQLLEGLRVHIPEGALGDARALDAFEAALHGS